jgi:hypothetical protein
MRSKVGTHIEVGTPAGTAHCCRSKAQPKSSFSVRTEVWAGVWAVTQPTSGSAELEGLPTLFGGESGFELLLLQFKFWDFRDFSEQGLNRKLSIGVRNRSSPMTGYGI